MNSRIEEMADLRSAKNPKARIKILKGHFATSNSHLNTYIDMSTVKTRHNNSREVYHDFTCLSRAIYCFFCENRFFFLFDVSAACAGTPQNPEYDSFKKSRFFLFFDRKTDFFILKSRQLQNRRKST